MKFDFDRVVDRKSTNDMKWNSKAVESYLHVPIPENIIPMWLADMDVACPPAVQEAIIERAKKEIYGYCAPTPEFMKAVCYWQKARHNFDVDASWIGDLPSVVAGINVAIRTLTEEGDGVIIQQPVYDPFETIVKRSNRTMVNNALICEDGYYTMDYELLEKQAKDSKNKLMILCSPHNPAGRVWKAEELIKAADICIANGVKIVVDEIHSDIVFKGHKHYPLMSLKEEYKNEVIMLTSPGKTFNVAGLKMSISIIANEQIRKAFNETKLAMSLDVRNTFGIESIIHCYKEENIEWLEQLLEYIEGNADFVCDYVEKNMPGVKFRKPEGTYLGWLDMSGTNIPDNEIMKDIILGTGVICVPGNWFGAGGEGHIRLNMGCPKAMLEDALDRFTKALNEKLNK